MPSRFLVNEKCSVPFGLSSESLLENSGLPGPLSILPETIESTVSGPPFRLSLCRPPPLPLTPSVPGVLWPAEDRAQESHGEKMSNHSPSPSSPHWSASNALRSSPELGTGSL